MFHGYLTYAGQEIVNVDRLMAYVEAGLHPQGVHVQSPYGRCEGLGDALGHGPYRTPDLDAAPWYVPTDPDTWGFAGVLPLEVTGMSGSTRTVGVEELTGDGGVAQLARRTTRTITVSALLIGETAEAVQAGYRWLTTALTRECQPGSDCSGGTLTAFTVCPGPLGETEDVQAPLESHVEAPGGDWHIQNARWNYTAGVLSVTAVAPGESVNVLDGGAAATVHTDTVDGGNAASTFDPGVSGGNAASAVNYGVLGSPTLLGCLSRVEADWNITPLDGQTINVRLGAVDRHGRTLEVGAPFQATGATPVTYTRDHAPWEEWRPALWLSAPGATVTLDVRHRPDLDPEECLRPHRRTYANLTTVQPPQEVARLADDCGSYLLQVEWTWVAGDPFVYTTPAPLVSGLSATTAAAPAYNAPGVTPAYDGTVTAAATACALPAAPVSCALDPTYPGFTAPPAAPVVADPGAVTPTTYHRSRLTLDPSVVPNPGVGALTFTFDNDATAKRGVRVRLWTSDDPDFGTVNECDFVQEWYIGYIDPNATLIVDTIGQTVQAVCDDGSVADARGVMRGPYRGAFTYPTVACGDRYFITVDTPDATGTLTWSLSLAGREG